LSQELDLNGSGVHPKNGVAPVEQETPSFITVREDKANGM
jgi:hypothetical protein